MGKAKKIGIGIGIVVLVFIILGNVLAFQGSSSTSDSSQFDPEITQIAVDEITDLKKLYEVIRVSCEAVDSSSDYHEFRNTLFEESEGDVLTLINSMQELISEIFESGYMDHSIVGPMVDELIQEGTDMRECVDKINRIYG